MCEARAPPCPLVREITSHPCSLFLLAFLRSLVPFPSLCEVSHSRWTHTFVHTRVLARLLSLAYTLGHGAFLDLYVALHTTLFTHSYPTDGE